MVEKGFGYTASWWWLRSPGNNSNNASNVNNDGEINTNGNNINNTSGGVRPALSPTSCSEKPLGPSGRVSAMRQRNQQPSCWKR